MQNVGTFFKIYVNTYKQINKKRVLSEYNKTKNN